MPDSPKFTPGPWELGIVVSFALAAIDDENGLVPAASDAVVYCVGDQGSDPETEIRIEGPRALADARLIAAAPDMYEALAAIMRHGEMACVDVEGSFYRPSGKKPATKEVWQFPRHMLTEIEAALAKARGEDGP